MKHINDYEKELVELVRTDKNNWSQFYLLMTEVEEKELFKEKEHKSFTAWLKDFALVNKMHESILWNRKKAGKIYFEYQQQKSLEGVELPPIDQTNISMDNLISIDKIKKTSPKLAEDMMDKLSKRELTRAEVRQIEARVKNTASKHKNTDAGKNNDATPKVVSDEENQAIITATKILSALNSPMPLLGRDIETANFVKSADKEKYKLFDEFRVFTGTTTKSRRIDAVVLENFNVASKYHELTVHGVEIKVAKWDLLNDKKYTEYAEYVHHLWVAIPNDLLEFAENVVPASIGLLVMTDGVLSKYREASKLEPSRLKETMTVASIKML